MCVCVGVGVGDGGGGRGAREGGIRCMDILLLGAIKFVLLLTEPVNLKIVWV